MPDDLTALDLECLWHPLLQHQGFEDAPPRLVERGEGSFLVDADGIRRLIRAPCLLPRVTELRCRHSRQRRTLQPTHLTACLPTKRQTLRQPSTKIPEKTPEQMPKFPDQNLL